MLQLIETDIDAIITRLTASYQASTGRTLTPADPESLLIHSMAYEVALIREQLNHAVNQMFVPTSTGTALDALSQLVAIHRLPATGASVSVQFSLASSHPGVVIPAGTRVSTTDGFVFATTQDISVSAGVLTADGDAIATEVGLSGNGYAVGDVTNIIDTRPFLTAVVSTSVSSGGSDVETDEELRERIQLGPSQSSVAGPTNSYEFFARQASSTIIDVAVTSDTPGTVQVYPLIGGGIVTPQGVLDLVSDQLNATDVRPLTDTVVVASPTITAYNIELEIVAYDDSDVTQLEADVTAAVTAYIEERTTRLGLDATVSQIGALAHVTPNQTYGVTIVQPAADVVVAPNAVAVGTLVSVSVTSQTPG